MPDCVQAIVWCFVPRGRRVTRDSSSRHCIRSQSLGANNGTPGPCENLRESRRLPMRNRAQDAPLARVRASGRRRGRRLRWPATLESPGLLSGLSEQTTVLPRRLQQWTRQLPGTSRFSSWALSDSPAGPLRSHIRQRACSFQPNSILQSVNTDSRVAASCLATGPRSIAHLRYFPHRSRICPSRCRRRSGSST